MGTKFQRGFVVIPTDLSSGSKYLWVRLCLRACRKTIRSYRNPCGSLQLFLRFGKDSKVLKNAKAIVAEIPKELKHYVVTVGSNIELKRGRASHFIYETRELRRQPAERPLGKLCA